MSQLSSPLDKWLARVDPDKIGVHRTMFIHAMFLLEEGHTEDEAFEVIRRCADVVDERYVPDREVWSAIESARRRVLGMDTGSNIRWPEVFVEWRNEILRAYATNAQTVKAAMPEPVQALDYLRQLYQPDDLVCVACDPAAAQTVRLQDIPECNNLGTHQFINPSPMSAIAGLTDSGNWSAHAKSNTGPRVYAVVEFDSGGLLDHAALLKYLQTLLPLVMIVYSGGSSLHGWFKTSHLTESQVENFYKNAVRLGADSKMFSPCQFTRLPMGRHATSGRTQAVMFFNPMRAYYK